LRIPIPLSLECVVGVSSANNLTQVLIEALMHEGGLAKDLISKRLMTFGAMGFWFSKSLGQVLENRLLMVRLNIPWGCIIWIIEPTLWFRLYYICNGEQN
jgi:hypothetical protein